MAESIDNLNKQIASFILLSAALAVPTVSSSVDAATCDLIADASVLMTPMQSVAKYAAPQIPQVNINDTALIQLVAKYAAPQIPQNPAIINQYVPLVARYAAPQIPQNPVIINQDVPLVARYAAPQVPPVQIYEPGPITIEHPTPMVFYGSPSIPDTPVNTDSVIPVNVIEKQVVPMPQTVKEKSLSAQRISGNGSLSNIQKVNNANINANIKTEDFVFSEYGNVKIVEPFAHFIFK